LHLIWRGAPPQKCIYLGKCGKGYNYAGKPICAGHWQYLSSLKASKTAPSVVLVIFGAIF